MLTIKLWGRIIVGLLLLSILGIILFAPSSLIAQADSNQLVDLCDRPLEDVDGIPIYYQNACNSPNNSQSQDQELSKGIRFDSPYVAFTTGGSWVDAVSMDYFDADSRLDMAVTTSAYFDTERDNHVWVARQESPVTFTLQYSAAVGARDPESMDVADMNGDGLMDLIVANAHGTTDHTNDVEIFFGVSAFSFIRTDHASGNTPYAVAVLPVAEKSLAVVTNWNSSILSTYLGGDGHVATQTNYSAPTAGYNQLAVGDVNGDGNLDAVAMWGQIYAVPAFTVYYGNGQGGFSVGPNFPKNNSNPNGIAVGDVTNDGRDDVILAGGGNSAWLRVYSQQADGSLLLTNTYSSYDIPESLDIADVNCDGLNDVIATNAGFSAFSWWPGTSSGGLGAYQVEHHSFYFSHIRSNGAEMADVNGDGWKDYVVVDYNTDGVLVALQKPCRSIINYLYFPSMLCESYTGDGEGICTP